MVYLLETVALKKKRQDELEMLRFLLRVGRMDTVINEYIRSKVRLTS